MNDLNLKIKDFVVENFLFGDDAGIDNDTSFMENGIIDSMGILELEEYISEEFHITIDDVELLPENFDSIQRIVDFIELKTKRAMSC